MNFNSCRLTHLLCTLLTLCVLSSCQETSNEFGGTYTLLSPSRIRPNSDLQVSVWLTEQLNEPVTFDLTVSGPEAASGRFNAVNASANLRPGDTRLLSMPIGEWTTGNYKLLLVARSRSGGIRLRNNATLHFQPKSYSVLIQLDKPMYQPGQIVRFRALVVNAALLPAVTGAIDVYVEDPKGNRVQSWNRVFTRNGVFTGQLQLSPNPPIGNWRLVVQVLQQRVERRFQVAQYRLPSFEADLLLPSYATYNRSRVLATCSAHHLHGKPVQGECILTVRPRSRYYSSTVRPLAQVQISRALSTGRADFELDLVRDLQLGSEVYGREIEFSGQVQEQHSGRTRNTTRTLRLYERELKVDLLRECNNFKPGLPFHFQLRVSHPDDTPYEPEEALRSPDAHHLLPNADPKFVKVFYGYSYNEENYTQTMDLPIHKGIAQGTIYPPRDEQLLILGMRVEHQGLSYNLESTEAAQTMSSHHIQVRSPALANGVQLGQRVTVTVNGTEPLSVLVYEVVARGEIVFAKSINASGNQQTQFELQITHKMAPKARLVVHYARPSDHELLLDAIVFHVEGLFRTPVQIHTSTAQAKPGQQIEVQVRTKPNAFVALLGIDQAVVSLHKDSGSSIPFDITRDEVIKELSSYDISRPERPTWYRRRKRSIQPDSLVTAGEILDQSGLIMMTDAKVFRYSPSVFYRMNSPVDSIDGVEREGLLNENEISYGAESSVLRRYFPETWIWDSKPASSNGNAVFSYKVPDSITSWVISSFAIDQVTGLGINQSPTKLRVFKQFFVKLNLPISVIRGERFLVQVMIYNYLPKAQDVEVTLHNQHADFRFVQAASDDLAGLSDTSTTGQPLQRKKLVRVAGDSVAATSFLVTANRLGEINLKVSALGGMAGDSVVRSLKVKPEGQVQFRNEARLVYLTPMPAKSFTPEESKLHPLANESGKKRSIQVAVPSEAVRGSSILRVSLLGDLLGSTMHHLTDLVRLPYGCGEQNMIHFVPNILVMEYLRRSNRLTASIKDKLLHHMQIGYQNELTFRRTDGSFSAFGAADSQGSTWLTAFVLRSFLMARPYLLHLDSNVTNQAAHWLVERQLSDGSFDEPGEVHFKPLQGATGDGQAALTAFVCLALSEDSALSARYARQITRAGRYLSHHVQNNLVRSVHELALIAYTLRRLDFDTSADITKRLLSMHQSDSQHVWWSSKPAKSTTEQIANETLSIASSSDVEATAYALLTQVLRGEIDDAIKIVSWLVAQQNGNGGFQSTQDTVVGLQAMAAIANRVGSFTNRLQVRFRLQYEEPSFEQIVEMQVNQNNSLQMQSFELADGEWSALPADQRASERSTDAGVCRGAAAFGHVLLNATGPEKCPTAALHLTNRLPVRVAIESDGVGSAIAQVSWQYNLIEAASKSAAFRMHYDLEQSPTSDGFMLINVCGSYSNGNETNMAVMEVNLPSGYAPDEDGLQTIRSDNRLVKKVESDTNNRVAIYFDRITTQQTCVSVPAQRVAKVAQLQPVLVQLYDYYDKAESARLFYSPPPATVCSICERSDCGASCGLNSTDSNEIIEPESSASDTPALPSHLLFVLLSFLLPHLISISTCWRHT